jgi:hypothetical protein
MNTSCVPTGKLTGKIIFLISPLAKLGTSTQLLLPNLESIDTPHLKGPQANPLLVILKFILKL